MNGHQEYHSEERIRQQLEQMIEAARVEIELAIAQAERTQHEGVGAEMVDGLRAQLALLDGHAAQIQSGSLIQLQRLQAALPSSLNAIRQTSQSLAHDAGFQIGQHVTEMSLEKIHALQARHDAQARDFVTYEAQSAMRIDHLAATSAVDVSGYRANRAHIQADIEAAIRDGDRTGLFKGHAQLAANNLYGLVKVGADNTEIEDARRKAAEARARYLKEKEIEALQAGKAAGLSGDILEAYVDQASATAAHELDTENARNAERVGLTPEQMVRAGAINAGLAESDQRRVTNMVQREAQSSEFSIAAKVPDPEENAKIEELAQLAAVELPTRATKFEVKLADRSEEKQPTALAPEPKSTEKDGALIQ